MDKKILSLINPHNSKLPLRYRTSIQLWEIVRRNLEFQAVMEPLYYKYNQSGADEFEAFLDSEELIEQLGVKNTDEQMRLFIVGVFHFEKSRSSSIPVNGRKKVIELFPFQLLKEGLISNFIFLHNIYRPFGFISGNDILMNSPDTPFYTFSVPKINYTKAELAELFNSIKEDFLQELKNCGYFNKISERGDLLGTEVEWNHFLLVEHELTEISYIAPDLDDEYLNEVVEYTAASYYEDLSDKEIIKKRTLIRNDYKKIRTLICNAFPKLGTILNTTSVDFGPYITKIRTL